MSRRCEICDKGTMTGMSISHSHIRNKKKWAPNLQRVRQWLMVHQKTNCLYPLFAFRESYKSYLKQKQAYRACFFVFLSFCL